MTKADFHYLVGAGGTNAVSWWTRRSGGLLSVEIHGSQAATLIMYPELGMGVFTATEPVNMSAGDLPRSSPPPTNDVDYVIDEAACKIGEGGAIYGT